MIVQAADRARQIREYYFSSKLAQIREMNANGSDIINLGIGNPDLPPHPSVIEVLNSASNSNGVHGYQPYRGIAEFREAISVFYSKHYGIEPDPDGEILPLIGSKEGIVHLSMAFLNRGDAVLVPDPGYPAYSAAAHLCGARCIFYDLTPENNWLPDIEKLETEDLRSVKMMWVNYPNMPTGTPASEDIFSKLVSFGRRNNILIVNDNPYSFILNETPKSILVAKGADGIALELNSLSKSHNMAGWRIGMVVGNSELINNIVKVKSNMDSGMFLPVQKAAVKALGLGKEWFASLNQSYRQRRDMVLEIANELGCRTEGKQCGMFIWTHIPGEWNSSVEFSDMILDKYGIFITPGTVFGTKGLKYARISLCIPEDKLKECIKRIKQ